MSTFHCRQLLKLIASWMACMCFAWVLIGCQNTSALRGDDEARSRDVSGNPDGSDADESEPVGPERGDPDGGDPDFDQRDDESTTDDESSIDDGPIPEDDTYDEARRDDDVETDSRGVASRSRASSGETGSRFEDGPAKRDHFFTGQESEGQDSDTRRASSEGRSSRPRRSEFDEPRALDDDILPDRDQEKDEEKKPRYRGTGAFLTPHVDRTRPDSTPRKKKKKKRTPRRGIPETSDAPDLDEVDSTQSWAVSGKYRRDPRFRELASEWAERVDRAVERLHAVTGLRLPEGQPPRVVLTPLGDEHKMYELRGEIVDGHNHLRLLVNAEPLMARTADPDRTLLACLGASVLESLIGAQRSTPAWLSTFAGMAASGDLSQRLDTLHRKRALGDSTVLRVDPRDPETAEATAIAAMLVLLEEGNPRTVRNLLSFAADGDDPHVLMGRFSKQPDGAWVEPAVQLLQTRVRTMDEDDWTLLLKAEEALATSGGAGMESLLPALIPREIRDEVDVLRAEAALSEGDSQTARDLLRGLPADAASRLRRPAHALALLIRAESSRDGDPRAARRLMTHLDRDFPKSDARRVLQDADPMLGMQEDPLQWLEVTRTRVDAEGPAFLDLKGCETYARMLLADHRTGAAESFVMMVSKRGIAPELHELGIAITNAQEEPSSVAMERASERIEAWLERPREDETQDVIDSGRAASLGLRELLQRHPDGDMEERDAIVDILVRAAGSHRGLQLLHEVWRTQPQFVARDLDVAASVTEFADLRDAAMHEDLHALTGVAPAEQWRKVTMSMPGGWLEEHPGFMRHIRADAYLIRQRAFSAASRARPPVVTRPLLERTLADSAALMRRDGVRVAGTLGHPDLVRRMLKDPTWIVRQACCDAVVDADDREAVALLVERLQEDDSPEVRKAAATSLLRIANRTPKAMQALLRLQRGAATPVQEYVAHRLAKLKPMVVAQAVQKALSQELGRKKMKRAYLYRLFGLFQRVTRVDVRYHPGSKRSDIARMVKRVKEWLQESQAAIVDASRR